MAITMEKIATTLGVEPPVVDFTASHAAPLEEATSTALSFFFDKSQADFASQTQAGVVVTTADLASTLPAQTHKLVVENPRATMPQVLALFAPVAPQAGVHPTAVVDETATVAASAYVGPHCVIGPNVHVGEGTVILGQAWLAHCRIGARVLLHPGVRIGTDGFGFVPGAEGANKIPHVGTVEVGDDVEIGANSTIDRGTMGATRIGPGSKLDNQVQVAHNVTIGAHCLIAAQVGLAGSCTLGNGCMLGGQVGVADHVELADGTTVAGGSGVTKSITEPKQTWAGLPAQPMKNWRREVVALRQLTKKGA